VANGRAWCSMQHRPELGAIEAASKGAWGQWHAEGKTWSGWRGCHGAAGTERHAHAAKAGAGCRWIGEGTLTGGLGR
jgi:hypothetical protein